MSSASDAWALRGVTKSFGTREVLRDFSLEIAPGECVGLVGANGAGKTTAARLLLGLEHATSGQVVIPQGARMAAQFQEDRLVAHLDALANVSLVLAGAGTSALHAVNPAHAVDAALDAVGLEERDRHTPVRSLSGGQRRRVGIARALAFDAQLLVWDEPLSGVDAEAIDVVLAALKAHRGGRRMLVISHVPQALEELADRIVTV